MSVTTFDSRTPFQITLSVPAATENGAVVLTEANFVPVGTGAVQTVFGRAGAVTAASGDYDAGEVTNNSDVDGATVADALNALDAARSYPLQFTIPSMATATTGYLPVPAAGTIVKAQLCTSATIDAGADPFVDLYISGTLVDMPALALPAESPASTVATSVPTADNTLTTNDIILVDFSPDGNTSTEGGVVVLWVNAT